MNVLDLFSGIGGFSLGLERAGMRTVAFCEIDPFCQRVLRKHWPDVPVWGDVRTLTADSLAAILANPESFGRSSVVHDDWSKSSDRKAWLQGKTGGGGLSIDVICGGFPCQDISVAGKGAGLAGSRSGLWREYARIIGEVRPRYVIVENVSALLHRGLGDVLGDLAALGYDAEWHCIPASAVGAPHRRDRVWIVAYPNNESRRIEQRFSGSSAAWSRDESNWRGSDVADAARHVLTEQAASGAERQRTGQGSQSVDLADAERWGRHRRNVEPGAPPAGFAAALRRCLASENIGEQWLVEPELGRVAHGVPDRVDRLRSLGNAVVPQITEMIGRAIMGKAGRPHAACVPTTDHFVA